MRSLFVLSLAFLAACGGSTEPGKAGDPALLITNNLDHDFVYITWQDGDAIIGKDSVAPRTASQCVRFLAQPDSAKWIVTASEDRGGGQRSSASVGGVWFDPAARPAWTVVVNSGLPNSAPSIIANDVDVAC